jgi:hypothetical protein
VTEPSRFEHHLELCITTHPLQIRSKGSRIWVQAAIWKHHLLEPWQHYELAHLPEPMFIIGIDGPCYAAYSTALLQGDSGRIRCKFLPGGERQLGTERQDLGPEVRLGVFSPDQAAGTGELEAVPVDVIEAAVVTVIG